MVNSKEGNNLHEFNLHQSISPGFQDVMTSALLEYNRGNKLVNEGRQKSIESMEGTPTKRSESTDSKNDSKAITNGDKQPQILKGSEDLKEGSKKGEVKSLSSRDVPEGLLNDTQKASTTATCLKAKEENKISHEPNTKEHRHAVSETQRKTPQSPETRCLSCGKLKTTSLLDTATNTAGLTKEIHQENVNLEKSYLGTKIKSDISEAEQVHCNCHGPKASGEDVMMQLNPDVRDLVEDSKMFSEQGRDPYNHHEQHLRKEKLSSEPAVDSGAADLHDNVNNTEKDKETMENSDAACFPAEEKSHLTDTKDIPQGPCHEILKAKPGSKAVNQINGNELVSHQWDKDIQQTQRKQKIMASEVPLSGQTKNKNPEEKDVLKRNDITTESDGQKEKVKRDTKVTYKSVASSPIVPLEGSSCFSFALEKGAASLQSPLFKRTRQGQVTYRSVANSPIVLKEGSAAFSFASEQEASLRSPTYKFKRQEGDMHPGGKVTYRSVANSPIVPADGSLGFSFFKDQGASALDSPPRKTKKSYVSVAVSPIVPSEGSEAFPFASEQHAASIKSPTWNPTRQDGSMVSYVSVAVSPIVPPEGSVAFYYASVKQDIATQTINDSISCRSVAISPILPPEGTAAFSFATDRDTSSLKSPTWNPARQESDIRSGNKLSYVSVAVSPIVSSDGTVAFSFASGKQDEAVKQDAETQTSVDHVNFVSVAVSPIVLTDGTAAFRFASDHETSTLKSPSYKGQTQSNKVDYVSVALSPIVIQDGSETFEFASEDVSSLKSPTIQVTKPEEDTQSGSKVIGVSVASSPIVFSGGSETFDFASESKEYLKSATDATRQKQDAPLDSKVNFVSVANSPIVPPEGYETFDFSSNQVESRLTSPTIKVTRHNNFQSGNKVTYVSVANSPIVPPGGYTTFDFASSQKESVDKSSTIKNARQDGSVENSIAKSYVSVAVSPMIPPEGSEAFKFSSREESSNLTSPKIKVTRHDDAEHVTLVSVAVSPIVPPGGSDTFQFSSDEGMSSLKSPIYKVFRHGETKSDSKVTCVSVASSPIVPPGMSDTFSFASDSETASLLSPKIKITRHDDSDEGSKINYVSIAVSPIVPPDESGTFKFASESQKEPQKQDASTQTIIDFSVSSISVAVSPIIPPEGQVAFNFLSEAAKQELPSLNSSRLTYKCEKKDVELQVSIHAETRSVATDPMTPMGKSSRSSYPEVRVKATVEEQPEPVREVSWDEKGMTWEVYGASMEVEVLGLAIQKHLEKQIEEHGKQKVTVLPNPRTSSIKGVKGKGERKRQPNVFRAFLQNMRRPQCCSRGSAATE
ncbi:G protein-regulated inducer of neurite outgrowth 1 [Protopterus annectens]|uniref:G protein-regulated inducer of neurite outgrowth 1 n=1 Tax=Protopterus annectens TaxID=7888 RepID=UPI001CFA2D44|nr:G protein-regulated inducer of neurite outgrowth 1 [Protopterus annectens]